MQIDFSQVLNGFDGTPLRQIKVEGQPPEAITLRDAAVEALNRPEPREQIDEVEKLKRFTLSLKVYGSRGDGADLTVEDIALIKQRIGKIFPPIVVGRSFELLDPPKP